MEQFFISTTRDGQAAVGSAMYVLCKSAALDKGMHALGQGLGWAIQNTQCLPDRCESSGTDW